MENATRPCAHCGEDHRPARSGSRFSYCGRCWADYTRSRRHGTTEAWHAARARRCGCGGVLPNAHAKQCVQCAPSPAVRRYFTCDLPACHNLCASSHREARYCSNKCKLAGKKIRRIGLHAVAIHPHWVLSQAVQGPTMDWLMALPVFGPQLTDWPAFGPPRPLAETPKTCQSCGVGFMGSTARRFCSERCSRNPIDDAEPTSCDVKSGHCRRCGESYVVPAYRKTSGCCSAECARRLHRSIRRRKVRAQRKQIRHEPYTLREIAERDGWRCHLCGGKVPDRDYTAHDKDATIDHLIPQSCGGDDVKSNVALAHNRCNWERKDGGAAQLRLVG